MIYHDLSNFIHWKFICNHEELGFSRIKTMEFQHQHYGLHHGNHGISNEIHVQVASILLAACFDDIDLVKRNVWPRNPRKSSRVFWGVDGVGEISGRHRLSGWHKGGPVITGMFFRWICCGDSLIIIIHWSCMGTPTQTCVGCRYQMSGDYLKNCLALLPYVIKKDI